MFNTELQALEGVWVGTEHISDGDNDYAATGRLVFQTVFDGRFMLCDHMQTALERPPVFSHGVFRRTDKTLMVTWFRLPDALPSNADGVAEGDKLEFFETIDGVRVRTSYVVAMDKLSVHTDRAVGDDWKRVFAGTYRRR